MVTRTQAKEVPYACAVLLLWMLYICSFAASLAALRQSASRILSYFADDNDDNDDDELHHSLELRPVTIDALLRRATAASCTISCTMSLAAFTSFIAPATCPMKQGKSVFMSNGAEPVL
mmetsp:Transcript_22737/g.44269  ORF Transcript_22737/g.44269 Transcript_22737/m.44269 type:complete len:119 (+) Transcript_22737:46-402(+)